MQVQVIFEGEVNNRGAIVQMMNEDVLFATKEAANISLRALGSRIDRIETTEGVQKVFIKSIDNLLLG